ncbi:MAG: hypothetical protein U0V48_17345 [Anaerolineales bacterium]
MELRHRDLQKRRCRFARTIRFYHFRSGDDPVFGDQQFLFWRVVFKTKFYGVIRVREIVLEGSNEPALVMSHGITVHGLQFTSPALRDVPTTYYVRDGGAGLAILNHPKYGKKMRVGMLGVGAGTLAAYGQPGDVYRLYEINPVVISLAEGQGGYFSFVSDSAADVTMIPGDARISLERELATRCAKLTCWSWTRLAVTRSPFILLRKKPLPCTSNTSPPTESSPRISRTCISICNPCSGNWQSFMA